MMSIGEYQPYFETKDFMSKHFIPDLEGVLSLNLKMDLTVSRLRLNGNRNSPLLWAYTISRWKHVLDLISPVGVANLWTGWQLPLLSSLDLDLGKYKIWTW